MDTSSHTKRRIAIVTQGVKLPGESRGYTRFRKIAEMLAAAGFSVDLITSTFQHWDKRPRNTGSDDYVGNAYNIVFMPEPGYKRNLDPARILSHRHLADNLKNYFEGTAGVYSLIYSEIPPNDMARVCAQAAADQGIPFVADINDLWPEAMRMVLDIPVVSDVIFSGFSRDAHAVYEGLTAAVGTSAEYADRPALTRTTPYLREVVYVGNDLSEFDKGVAAHAASIEKPEGETWVSYAGTLGASYDIATLIDAAALLYEDRPNLRIKILGDGPDREALESRAGFMPCNVDFLGYTAYDEMAAYLHASDIVVNSLVCSAPQSIVTKIGDYLAAGKPMINTGSSAEFRLKVEEDGFGVNIIAEDSAELAGAIVALLDNPEACAVMGKKARRIAEEQFDQSQSYGKIVALIDSLTR